MRRFPAIRLFIVILFGGLTTFVLTSGVLTAQIVHIQAEAAIESIDAEPLMSLVPPLDFAMPGTQPHNLSEPIVDSASCNGCHIDPIYDAWRGSMMGQAGRDPIFWAALAVAEEDAPGSGEFCLRCHTPKGWLEGRSHQPDGSALALVDIDNGVACAVCHRLVDPQPSIDDEAVEIDAAVRSNLTSTVPIDRVGSGMMIVDPVDNRRGPFSLSPPHPGETLRTDFLGQDGNALTESRHCATCHTIDNPALVWTEDPPGGAPAQFWLRQREAGEIDLPEAELYPIETTYDEWLLSDYPDGVYAPAFAGAMQDGMVASCQDCHMPRTTGQAAIGGVDRDCRTNGCLPAHTLVGGNTWVPQILQDTRWRLNAAPEAERLDATRTAAQALLRKAATLTVSLAGNGAEKVATVRVINESGHKLPTGYAEGRRMWLNLRAYDAEGSLIYESGEYDAATGELTHDTDIKVYEVEQGLTPELAQTAGLTAGPSFHFALNNTVYKDNRIPPRGYLVELYDRPGLKPIGATYVDGQYWDDTEYRLPVETRRVAVTLYYQTVSKEYITFLREKGGNDGAVLGQMWDDNKGAPEPIASASAPEYQTFLPLLP